MLWMDNVHKEELELGVGDIIIYFSVQWDRNKKHILSIISTFEEVIHKMHLPGSCLRVTIMF